MQVVQRNVRQITPKLDERSVGIGFIDVLFALVIGKVLASVDWNGLHHLTGTQAANLSLATLVTLTSWIGYHNSVNRPRFKIRFFNLPLAQFTLDILMVFDYWVLSTIAGSGLPTKQQSPVMAGLVFGAFVLYCLWDLFSFLIGRQQKYQDLIGDSNGTWPGYNVGRNAATWICTILCLVVWLLSLHLGHSARWAYANDAVLAVIAVAFRVMKDSKVDPERDPVLP